MGTPMEREKAVKLNEAARILIAYPVKAIPDLKKSNCFELHPVIYLLL
jgi:hypothetical protein